MKKVFFLAIIAGLITSACNIPWTEESEQKFVDECVEKASSKMEGLDASFVEGYCSCALGVVKEETEGPIEAVKVIMKKEFQQRLLSECMGE